MVTTKEAQTGGMFVEEITIGGRKVQLRHRDLPVDEVRLNPENQRVQFLLSFLDHAPTEQEIGSLLWDLDDVKMLRRSVKLNGGLIERIIVKVDGTVIEGNCRTVVYRRLREEAEDAGDDEAKELWSAVPARVLPEDIDDKELAYLLGELHVAGKNEWTAFEQAAYVYKMTEDYGYTVAELAEHLRLTKTSINQLFWAYRLMKERFLIDSKDKSDILKWSYFLEFYKGFRRKADAEPWEERFVRWVRTGILNKGVQVRKLPKIVEEPEALEALEEAGYERAMEVLSAVQPGESSRLFSILDRATRELSRASLDEVQALRTGDQARINRLKELYRALTNIAEVGRVNLNEGSET